MFLCSMCTAGSSSCSLNKNLLCIKCNENVPHLCDMCIGTWIDIETCVRCTKRPHMCLSKCLRKCIYKDRAKCKCVVNNTIRFQSQKDNSNRGRFFWSCFDCRFFEWE